MNPPSWSLIHRAAPCRTAVWWIRRVQRGDAPLMQRFIDALGAASRRRRFHGVVKASGALTAALVEGDAVWAAFHGDALIGEARFVRERAACARAELAIAVADGWQGRGVAAALLDTLLAEACRAGVRTLHADVMCDNLPMQRFLLRHGFVPRLHWDGGADSEVFERELAAPAPWQRAVAWLRALGAAVPRRVASAAF